VYTIGIDLGGTNIAAGIVDSQYNIVLKKSIPTGAERPADAITADMAKLCRALAEEAGIPFSEIQSVGVAAPGVANSATGVIERSANLPHVMYPLCEKLSALLDGIQVYIENDANAAAKAEAMAGAARDARYSVMITLGTGVGGGIILDKQVYAGFNFAGAELGHIVIRQGGRPCGCGRKGCWERYSSATGLVQTTKETILACREQGRYTVMEKLIEGDLDRISGKTAFTAAKQGDEVGAEVVAEYIETLACGLSNIINIFQPEVLSIGGGICREGDYLLTPLKKRIFEEIYTKDAEPRVKVVIAQLGNDAGIIGAASLGR